MFSLHAKNNCMTTVQHYM